MSFGLLESMLSKPSKRVISIPKFHYKPCLPLTPPPCYESDIICDNENYLSRPNAFEDPAFNPLVAVIGVGYVGSQLVEALAKVYNVLAFDISDDRLDEIAQRFKGLSVRCTSYAGDLAAADYFLVSVPTALNPDKTVDVTFLQKAAATIEQHARPGATVIIESSVAVGMTKGLFGSLMSTKGLKVGMSPERIDPGRKNPAFESIPKIISGLDAASLESIRELYARVFDTLVPVSSPEVAEMTKLYENCQRMVCAAYANEMADACAALGIDAWEVSQAASSKPFGYLPFRPGPGIGGHCIPVNPYYLLSTCSMPILQHATEASWNRPRLVAERFMRAVLEQRNTSYSSSSRSIPATPSEKTKKKTPERPRLLVVGVGFKRGQSVTSYSPGVSILAALLGCWDVYAEFADPLVDQEALSSVPKMDTERMWNTSYLEKFDGILVAVDQFGLDLELLQTLPPDIVVHNYCPATLAAGGGTGMGGCLINPKGLWGPP